MTEEFPEFDLVLRNISVIINGLWYSNQCFPDVNELRYCTSRSLAVL
jgi:hypothetical protein